MNERGTEHSSFQTRPRAFSYLVTAEENKFCSIDRMKVHLGGR